MKPAHHHLGGALGERQTPPRAPDRVAGLFLVHPEKKRRLAGKLRPHLERLPDRPEAEKADPVLSLEKELAALLGAGVVRAYRWPERYGGRILAPILSVLGLATLGLFVFMTEIMARQLPPSAGAPQAGEKAPDFTLPDTQGRSVRLADLLGGPAGATKGGAPGSWVLLIFYRGYW